MKKTGYIIGLLLVAAFLVRLIIAFNTYVISSDGPFYLEVARDFFNGDFKAALEKQTFHPLYPFMIALFYKLAGNWEWAGLLVSILFSTIGIIPLYFIGKRYFSEQIVLISCLLYVFHPVAAQLSASIFTTGLFIGLFLFALWISIIALESGDYRYFLLSGLLSFLIYLVRPDGIVFLLITIVAILINPLLKNNTIVRRLLFILAIIIPWLLLMPPYIYSVNKISGIVDVTGKASITQMLGMDNGKTEYKATADELPENSEDPANDAPIKGIINALYFLSVGFIKGANVLLFLLFILGILSYFRREPDALKKPFFIWMVFFIFLLVLFRYAFLYERMSKRYTVPVFAMVIFWSGDGVYLLSGQLTRLLKRISAGFDKHKAGILYTVSIIVIILISIFTFKPVGKEKIIEKNTGEMLNKYHLKYGVKNKKPVIVTLITRIPYYANGTAISPEVFIDRSETMPQIIEAQHADYIVIDARISRQFPDLEEHLLENSQANPIIELISSSYSSSAGEKPEFYRTYKFTKN